jgi:hypothetical protein
MEKLVTNNIKSAETHVVDDHLPQLAAMLVAR